MEVKSSEVVAREGLRRNLEMWTFFKRLLKVCYVGLPLWLLLLVLDVPMTLLELSGPRAGETGRLIGLVVLDLLSIVVIGLLLKGLWGFRSYLKSTLRVEAGMLTITRDGQDVLIALKEVVEAKINTSFFCRVHECMRLKLKDGTEHVVPRGFQRLDYVVDTIAAVKPELATVAEWNAAREQVIAMDHAMARINDAFKNPARVFILYIGLPLFLGFIGMYYSPWPLTFWVLFVYWVGFAIVSSIVGVVIRAVVERTMVEKLRQQLQTDAKALRRQLDREAKLNYWVFVIHSLILAIPVFAWVVLVKLR